MRKVTLPNGTRLPQLGLGTWDMGEDHTAAAVEIAAIEHACAQGMRLFDTTEMYCGGGAEEVLGQALRNQQAAMPTAPYIVSKVYPYNASPQGVVEACEGSLRRLGVDQINLYLLHWRGGVPLAETIDGFERLIAAGKIGAWGVSNFAANDMAELWDAPGGGACQTNQVLYNLVRRWPEDALLPALSAKGVPLMAYSPLEQGALGNDPHLRQIANDACLDPMALALAWTLRKDQAFAIPKSTQTSRINGFIAAAEILLSEDTVAALDAAFPAPSKGALLEML